MITWLRSAVSFMAAAASSSVTTSDPAMAPCSSGHIDGSTERPPAPSTNDERQASNRCGDPAASDSASGDAVSGSAATTRTSGRRALITAAIPASNPPPPIAATTVDTPGRSSRISSPAVALPAMKASSSNGCTK